MFSKLIARREVDGLSRAAVMYLVYFGMDHWTSTIILVMESINTSVDMYKCRQLCFICFFFTFLNRTPNKTQKIYNTFYLRIKHESRIIREKNTKEHEFFFLICFYFFFLCVFWIFFFFLVVPNYFRIILKSRIFYSAELNPTYSFVTMAVTIM